MKTNGISLESQLSAAFDASENTNEDSNSSYDKDNLYIYNDKYIEYDDDNFKALNTYQELEKLTKNINYKNDDSKNFITNLAYKHRLNSETTRVIINPNFAILYDVNQDKVRIADLLFNTKIVNKNQLFFVYLRHNFVL